MKPNTLLSILATAAVGIVMAGPASATDFVWDGLGVGNNWSTPGNWTANSGYPDDNGDKATLRGDTAIELDVDVTIGELVIEDDAALKVDVASGTRVLTIEDDDETLTGKLTIEAGGELNIHGNGQVTLDGTTSHDIRGEVKLRESGAVLKFADSVTVAGAGKIVGGHNGAELQIVGDKTLTSTLDIVGKMKIKGLIGGANPATFVNDTSGVVRADAAGTLNLADGLALSGSGAWEVTGTVNSILKFDEAATGLTGPFVLNSSGANAELEINANITTTGDFTNTDGTLDVNDVNTGDDEATCFVWLFELPGEDEVCDGP